MLLLSYFSIYFLQYFFNYLFSLFFFIVGLIVLIALFIFRQESAVIVLRWCFGDVNRVFLNFQLFFDTLRISFFFALCSIVARIFIFSREYIAREKHFFRFHLLVLSFVVSMVLLIFSSDFLMAIIG